MAKAGAQKTGEKMTEAANKKRTEVVGEVISNKMQKTISVRVFNLVKHTRYGKYVRSSSIYKAHDAKSEAQLGDVVRIFETRPLSKTKRWTLAEVVERRNKVEGVEV